MTPQPPLLQVAIPLGGAGQGAHEPPHELTELSSAHSPLQSWVPAGHWPMHDCPIGRHEPTHSLRSAGQVPLHEVPSQVAVPPTGALHGVQDWPHDIALVLLAH